MNRGRVFIFFSLGIIAGGILSYGLINYFYSSNKISERVKKKNKTEKSETKTEERDTVYPKDSIGSYLDKKLPIRIAGDTASDVYEHIDNDSKVYDSLLAVREKSTENVNRDKLISTVKMGSSKWKLDGESLENLNKGKLITVEFWQSPINYKGYHINKSKLVVYGIKEEPENHLYDLGDYLILQSGSNFYQLFRSNEFKPLKKFTDEAILSKIKE